ncbi:hypothetical protein IV203_005781 [Nitzschia inconspicua]|uniref:SAM-dependent methyltransferase n=1 Tax=Nitzschia inconspicua TaxID=303405 RepID=A0A9K3KMZ6_9STRA|nr:hypothetical protein IV203_005781 [Nitzschia inconspicua]
MHRKTIVDVGTDHGLLAIGLALTGKFQKVIGVDVSQQALENGALSLLSQIESRRKGIDPQKAALDVPVEFRHGDGLKALEEGEADIVCMAGMGVSTLLQILEQDHDALTSDLNRRQYTDLILQPTNSKPRNLMFLYKSLQDSGWELRNERIVKLSSRWYVTSHFTRPQSNIPVTALIEDGAMKIPGSTLDCTLSDSDPMRQDLEEYCRHHSQWIRKDSEYGRMDLLEEVWLERFGNDR